MFAIVCPGQGSQSPGFLSPWLELPGVRERAERLSELTGIDVVTHGTVSDEETIKDTAVAQPLIVAAGLLALDPLLGEDGGITRAEAVAGHSVGEITAAAAAGVLSPDEALLFVRERGAGMAAASAVRPTGMSAVMGGDPDEVTEVIAAAGLTAANINGAGQVVAAGTLEQVEALTANPPSRARVIPLKVAGAFHTQHMAPAVSALAQRATGMTVRDPDVKVISNADGQVVTSGRELLDRLVAQVSTPVRWDLCMDTLTELGVTALIELPPAGTLTGLAKRGMRGARAMALKTPDDLEAARRIIAEHGRPTTEETA